MSKKKYFVDKNDGDSTQRIGEFFDQNIANRFLVQEMNKPENEKCSFRIGRIRPKAIKTHLSLV